jgi:hypothetical protein
MDITLDNYYLVSIGSPPRCPPILIKACSYIHFEKWSASGWIEGDYRFYLMGDYHYRQVSLQQAEEYMRGTPQHSQLFTRCH